MTLGLHTVNLADKWLNALRNVAFQNAATYVQLHYGDPGAAGTSTVSALATTPVRQQATLAAASGGSIALASNPTAWTAAAGSQETISHVSVWDASTSGNVLWTAAITSPQAWNQNNTFTLTSLGISLTPKMA